MRRASIIVVAGLLFLGSLGWRLRPQKHPIIALDHWETNAISIQDNLLQNPSISSESSESPAQTMTPLVTRLLALTEKSQKEQIGALQCFLHELSIEELRAGLQLLGQRDGLEDLQNVLLGRLAALDGTNTMRILAQGRYGLETPQAVAIIGGLAVPRIALSWLESLPASESRNQLLGLALGKWADSSGAEALNYALREPSAELRASLIAKVISVAARSHPTQGFEWAVQYQALHQEPDLLKLTALGWASSDYIGASSHILALPAESPESSEAMKGLVEYNLTRDLPRAFELIAQVKNPEDRHSYSRQAAREWMGQDEAAAKAWITSTTELTDADRQELLSIHPTAL